MKPERSYGGGSAERAGSTPPGQAFSPANIAVTGASGFIGRHVMNALTQRGDHVTAIPHPFDRAVLARSLQGTAVVVHLAGVVSAVRERDFFDANAASTQVVAEACRDAGARLVHISSLAAAGPAPASAPRSEDEPAAPVNAYGRSKLAGERAVIGTTGLSWTILRPGVVYGPGDRALRPLFEYARRRVLPLVGAGDAAYTFIYVADAVRAILAAIDRGAPGATIFVGHPQPVSPRELMAAICDVAHVRATIVPIPRPVSWLAAQVGEITGRMTGRPAIINRRRFAELYSVGFVCNVDRMHVRLGVVAGTGLRDGLKLAAGWYSQP